eukprot:scaffold313721_cov30-Tisochrysis_lutea.AAC.1
MLALVQVLTHGEVDIGREDAVRGFDTNFVEDRAGFGSREASPILGSVPDRLVVRENAMMKLVANVVLWPLRGAVNQVKQRSQVVSVGTGCGRLGLRRCGAQVISRRRAPPGRLRP